MKKNAKKICIFTVFLFAATQIFCGCAVNTNSEEKLLLTYVRADSYSRSAVSAANEVSAAIDYYIAERLDGISDFDSAYGAVKASLNDISLIATAVLKRNGIGYSVCVTLGGGLTVKLGLGYGNDTVSTAYPQSESNEANGIRYKSLIADALR